MPWAVRRHGSECNVYRLTAAVQIADYSTRLPGWSVGM